MIKEACIHVVLGTLRVVTQTRNVITRPKNYSCGHKKVTSIISIAFALHAIKVDIYTV